MAKNLPLYMMGGSVGLLIIIVIAYVLINKALNKGERKYLRELRKGTQSKQYSSDVIYQKLYNIYTKIPGLKRYVLKLRRKLEIISIQDEYQTRKKAATILTRALIIITILTLFIFLIARKNTLILSILLLFEVFMVESLIDGSVSKLDTKLLKQQIEFFAEIRHAYHEYNMIEEAIYQVSQNDELEISRQGEKIYEILISDNPEEELEKYYDVAPNSYLKEFAGLSYLTREFGDRQTESGASLYLKNLNNISSEMQIEILKRDNLDYVFQSLSFISIVPVLFLEPLKNWAVSNFDFTKGFYNGKLGLIVQMFIVLLTFVCYILIRKVKDTSSDNSGKNTQNPIQEKLYKIPLVKKIVDPFMPKKGTRQYKKMTTLLKDAASADKPEWIYINRLILAVVVFIATILFLNIAHNVAINYLRTEGTMDLNLVSTSKEKNSAEKILEYDNAFLDKHEGEKMTIEAIQKEITNTEFYENASVEVLQKAAQRLDTKLRTLNKENLRWWEVLMAMLFSVAGYMLPIGFLYFQRIMRQLEMEDEVMQYQAIILMLMKIERVNVEMILEWLERYANIFKAPISKCVNNYESGAWEALEELKNDVTFLQLIAIVESLQAAVEKIPIKEAFDELDSEREYYQEKRKASNEKLISKKGMIGKAIGFAPMISLFIGYLIAPLILIGLMAMTETFDSISAMVV